MQSRFNDSKFMFGSRGLKTEKENKFTSEQLTQATVNKSGNSDVDVNVYLDINTMPIALAFLCQSFASKQLTNGEFEIAVKKLFELTDKYKGTEKEKKSNLKYFNDNVWRG